MATLADINTKVTELIGVDTNTYPNANRLINLNLWFQKIVGMILDAQDETDYDDPNKTDYPIYTFSLVAGQRDYSIGQTYGILKIKDISVAYDGVNYFRATPMDLSDNDFIGNAPSSATTQNTVIDSNFPKTMPAYDYKFGSIWTYPMATATDVANGATAIVEFFRTPTDFTSSDLTTGTLVPGIDSTFHLMLAYGVAYEYAQAKQLPQVQGIAAVLADYENRLRKQYSSKQLDRKYAMIPEYVCYR